MNPISFREAASFLSVILSLISSIPAFGLLEPSLCSDLTCIVLFATHISIGKKAFYFCFLKLRKEICLT